MSRILFFFAKFVIVHPINQQMRKGLFWVFTRSGKSILDLIISDSPGFFVSSGTLSPTANCYHCINYANLNCRKQKPKSFTREICNFDDIDLDGLNGTLSNADWNDVFDASLFDIVVIYQRFFSILLSTVAQLLGYRWHCASDKKKIDWLLNGISTADFQINVRLFQLAQSFILPLNRSC